MINTVQKRPFKGNYETAEHRLVEQQVVARLIKGTGLTATKLPKRDVLDFVLTQDDKVVCFAEIRSRTISSDIEFFHLPLKKFNVIRSHYDASKTITALVVQFTDKVMRVWLGKTIEPHVVLYGTEFTDKEFDIEPTVKIAMNRFEPLWEVDS